MGLHGPLGYVVHQLKGAGSDLLTSMEPYPEGGHPIDAIKALDPRTPQGALSDAGLMLSILMGGKAYGRYRAGRAERFFKPDLRYKEPVTPFEKVSQKIYFGQKLTREDLIGLTAGERSRLPTVASPEAMIRNFEQQARLRNELDLLNSKAAVERMNQKSGTQGGLPYQEEPFGAFIPGENRELTPMQKAYLIQLNPRYRKERLELFRRGENPVIPQSTFEQHPDTQKAIQRMGYTTGLPVDDQWGHIASGPENPNSLSIRGLLPDRNRSIDPVTGNLASRSEWQMDPMPGENINFLIWLLSQQKNNFYKQHGLPEGRN